MIFDIKNNSKITVWYGILINIRSDSNYGEKMSQVRHNWLELEPVIP